MVGEKGGAEVSMIHHCRLLDRSRFTPAAVLLRPGPFEKELKAVGTETYVLQQHRRRNVVAVMRAVVQIARLAREQGFDLLNSNVFPAHLYGGWAARLAGIPAVGTFHTVEHPGLLTTATLAIPISHVVANNPKSTQFFRDHGKPTTMIWPGVDIETLRHGTPRSELAARYGLPPEKRWICMSGRLQRWKGQIEFIRTVAALADDPGFHAVIVGGTLFGLEPAYQQELRALAAELNVSHRVTFTGFVSDADLAGLIGSSYVTVHPARDEDFGLSVAEAQALGIPTIAFAAIGPANIIDHMKTGWVVPIGDQQTLNESLRTALRSPDLVARMGVAARERTARLFSLEQYMRQFEEVYSKVLGH